MPGFFKNFPLVYNDIAGTGNYNLVVDILRRFRIRDEVKLGTENYFKYQVQDMETPSILAHQFYGDPNHFWVIMMMNDMIDMNYDWPLSQRKLNEYVEKKYPDECMFLWSVTDNSNFKRGETITNQVGKSKTVYRYSPTYRRLEVSSSQGGFSVGDTITGASTGCVGVLRRYVLENPDALHHFTEDANPETTAVLLDPWADVGETPRAFTSVGTDASSSSSSGDISGSYLSAYITASSDIYAVTNWNHELAVNEDKRSIRVLHAAFLDTLLEDAKTVLSRRDAITDTFVNAE